MAQQENRRGKLWKLPGEPGQEQSRADEFVEQEVAAGAGKNRGAGGVPVVGVAAGEELGKPGGMGGISIVKVEAAGGTEGGGEEALGRMEGFKEDAQRHGLRE